MSATANLRRCSFVLSRTKVTRPSQTAARLFLVLVTLVLLGLCLGAKPFSPVYGDPLLEHWRWRTFPELSGLGAQCMAEGSDGRIWFGAIESIWSFDGTEWKNYPTAGSSVGGALAIARGPDGMMYVGGRGGIGRFDGTEWKQVVPTPGVRFGEVRKLAASATDGTLWAATAWGALRLRQSTYTLFTDSTTAKRVAADPKGFPLEVQVLPEQVLTKPRGEGRPTNRIDLFDVAVDARGNTWLGTAGGEVLRFEPAREPGTADKWSIFNESDGLACGTRPCVLPLSDGPVWVTYATGSGSANVFDGAAWKATPLSDLGVPGDCFAAMQTRDGAIWLSGRYIVSCNRGGRWQTYSKPAAPIPYASNFLLQTADGAVWIAGTGTEILRLDYQTPRWLTLIDLNFQWEAPDGARWFLHRDGRIVMQKGDGWTSYGVEDGLIDAPVALVGAHGGDVWVAGSHEHTAATARFHDGKWTRFVHNELSWGIDWRAVLAASDGSVWFGAAVDSSGPKEHRHGLLQFRDGQWIHHHQPGRAFGGEPDNTPSTSLPATQRPEPIGKYLILGESSRDGLIWAGRNVLVHFDGKVWTPLAPVPEVRYGIIECMLSTRAGELWLGTRQYGALRYDGRGEWQRHQGKGSLVANTVRSLAEMDDGSVVAATDRGVSRFDGQSWTAPNVLPEELDVPPDGGGLIASGSGCLWVNRAPREWYLRAWPKAPAPDPAHPEFWTRCRQFHAPPPRTTITAGTNRVEPPGNLAVFFGGSAPWRDAKDAQLEFSYRLDDGPWSAYSPEHGHSFFTLPRGKHRVEVRARDRDFNVDPAPAALDLTVLPPVWLQGWFMLLMALLGGGVATQSVRVFRERGRLRKVNRTLAGEVEERKHAQQDVALLSFALNNVREAAALVDDDGRLRFVNDECSRALGYGRDELLVMRMTDICPELAARWPEHRAQLKAKRSLTFETTYQARSGRSIPVEVSDSYFEFDGHGYHLALARDITERKRDELELRRAKDEAEAANRAKDRFLAVLSHELRTPLAPVLLLSSAIEVNESVPEDVRDDVAIIRSCAQSEARLIDDLLDMTRVAYDKLSVTAQPVDVHALLGRVAETYVTLAGLRGHRVAVELEARRFTVTGDAQRLEQVIKNLLDNALKYTPMPGQITLRTRNVTKSNGSSAASGNGGESDVFVAVDALPPPPTTPTNGQRELIAVDVVDTGIGIDASAMPQIFEPFEQPSRTLHEGVGGLGLGLTIARGIVAAHHGTLRVQSKGRGRGSTFTVKLAVVEVTEEQKAGAPKSDVTPTERVDRPSDKGRVLLVEDHAVTAHSLERLMTSAGYTVKTAGSVATAKEFLAAEPFDVLLSDLGLPDGDGTSVMQYVLIEGLPTPGIALTGYGREPDRLRALAAGFRMHLVKPVTVDQLLRALSSVQRSGNKPAARSND